MRNMRRRVGQGTLEYVLVLVIILLAIIAGAGAIKTSVKDNMFNAANTRINKATAALKLEP